MDRLRGVCGPKDLDRLAAKLLALDELPPAKLATRRWIVSETTIKCVFRTAKKALAAQPSLLRGLPQPIVVIGDLHGDLHTLARMLRAHGAPPATTYLFLGDYVDRGANGVEVLLLVLALACRHPRHVFLLRGNHESALMTRTYGFLYECRHRYSTHVYAGALKVFELLPLAAIIGTDVFAVHGGLAPGLTPAAIEAVARPVRMVAGTLALALVWGDPTCDPALPGFTPSHRGAGHLFGTAAYCDFCAAHGFRAVVRAHEATMRGTRVHFATCWTVFSRPRYLTLRNAGGTLLVGLDGLFEPRMFCAEAADEAGAATWPLHAEDELAALSLDNESVMPASSEFGDGGDECVSDESAVVAKVAAECGEAAAAGVGDLDAEAEVEVGTGVADLAVTEVSTKGSTS